MGVRRLEYIAERLVADGRPASEPVAVVQRGTFADQRTVSGTLGDVAARAVQAGVRAPAITVVGPVAALHDELAWFRAGPLAGRTVAVTRARAQASALVGRLRALGARVVEAPTLRIEPLEATLPDVGEFDLLCVTSLNGARRLLECCRDARDLRGPAIAAIGPGTAQALRAGGSAADIVPPRVVAESLVQALDGRPVRRALVARAEHARDVLPRRCAHAGRRSRSWRCTGPSPSRGVGPAVTKVSPTRDQCDRAQSSCRSRSPTRLDRHCTSSFEAPARGGGCSHAMC